MKTIPFYKGQIICKKFCTDSKPLIVESCKLINIDTDDMTEDERLGDWYDVTAIDPETNQISVGGHIDIFVYIPMEISTKDFINLVLDMNECGGIENIQDPSTYDYYIDKLNYWMSTKDVQMDPACMQKYEHQLEMCKYLQWLSKLTN